MIESQHAYANRIPLPSTCIGIQIFGCSPVPPWPSISSRFSMLLAPSVLGLDIITPLIAKGIALRCGLKLFAEKGLTNLVFNSDSLNLCNAFNHDHVFGDLMPIVHDCKELSSKFLGCPFKKNKKERYQEEFEERLVSLAASLFEP
ncbi:hypothetical protein RIF29_38740 [Crotalaria pallida]|uniref:RNase H type-1 domain-containing protein n=1 Tax=Crotalaria pallida TaxID=3830 RepID=A0AAN9E2D4_CROPI